MARQRPPVLTVMGILNIVFGSLFLLCNLCIGIVLLALIASPGAGGPFPGGVNPVAEMWTFVETEVPGFAVFTIGELVLNFVLAVFLVIAGIGLLNVQRWARILSIAYSIITVLARIGGLIFTLAIMNPAMERWKVDFVRRHGGALGGPADMGNSPLNNVFQLVGVVIGMAYAIVLLVMMLLPSVSAAFAERSRTADYDLDRPDDEEDDLRRERRQREDWHE